VHVEDSAVLSRKQLRLGRNHHTNRLFLAWRDFRPEHLAQFSAGRAVKRRRHDRRAEYVWHLDSDRRPRWILRAYSLENEVAAGVLGRHEAVCVSARR
jgi:hypothetical protein